MKSTLPARTWRSPITLLCATLLALVAASANLFASELTDTEEFAEIGAVVVKYAHKLEPSRILLALDIDNTLLCMDNPLGSDQWFEWQRYLIDHEPKSKERVADTFPGLLEAQGLLYNLSP